MNTSVVSILIALVSLAGIALGAGLQFWASGEIQTTKQLKELRHLAYRSYIEGVAQFGGKAADHARLNGARQLIALYASGRTVEKLVGFQRESAICEKPKTGHPWVAFVQSMREDIASQSDFVSDGLIAELLVLCESTRKPKK